MGIKNLFAAIRNLTDKGLGHIQGGKFRFWLYTYVRIAIDRDIGNIIEQFSTAVMCFRENKQVGVIINKFSAVAAVSELRMLQYIFQKENIGFNAAYTELLQTAQHLTDSYLMCQSPGGCFNEQGIVVRGDDGTSKRITSVQAYAKAAAAAISDQFTGIWHKIVGRILRSDTALDSMAMGNDVLLFGDRYFRIMDGIAFSNFNLCLYNIDTGDFFGNCMFNLNSWINFNKVEIIVRCC